MPRYVPGLWDASVLMSFFPLPLNELARRVSSRIKVGEIGTREAAIEFIETAGAERHQWAPTTEKFPDDFWVTATGIKDGMRARYTMVPASGWLSTAGPLYAAALRILDGRFEERGVLPPEACFDPLSFMEEVASNEPEWPKGKRLYDEKLEEVRLE